MSSDEEIERRKSLTFAQAEGVASLPTQLQLKEISQEFRSLLWITILKTLEKKYADNIYKNRGYVISGDWLEILVDHFVLVQHRPADDFDPNWDRQKTVLKDLVWSGGYVEIFDFIQFVLRHKNKPPRFSRMISNVLEESKAAYILIDGSTFAPKQTLAEANTFVDALEITNAQGMKGARQHLLNAASACSTGRYADSVRESIHAVESVAVRLVPGTKELGPALKKLEDAKAIHGAMKAGFASLYGFASDEQGIRHSLLDKDAAAVDEADALFMLGACAAFVSYLTNKGRAAGLL